MEQQRNSDWTDICVGRLSREEVANIAREVRQLWVNLENVYPGGDRKKKAALKVTLDKYGQYHCWLNHQALVYLLLFCKNIPNPMKGQQATLKECPPEVPDFLRWDSKPESTGQGSPA